MFCRIPTRSRGTAAVARFAAWLSKSLLTLEFGLFPRTVPRLARVLLLACFVVGIVGLFRSLANCGPKAAEILRSRAFLRSAWPVPTAELKSHLPRSGRIGFATDFPEGHAFSTHGHLQNRLAPLIVLREAEAGPTPRESGYVVMRFDDRKREAAFCADRGVRVVARCGFGYNVGFRR